MGVRIKAPFTARVKGGGVITFAGTANMQVVYWYMVSKDPRPESLANNWQWPAVGTLAKRITKTDKSKRCTNVYLGPDHLPLIKVGMHYRVGEVKVGQASGQWDRVTVKCTGPT